MDPTVDSYILMKRPPRWSFFTEVPFGACSARVRRHGYLEHPRAWGGQYLMLHLQLPQPEDGSWTTNETIIPWKSNHHFNSTGLSSSRRKRWFFDFQGIDMWWWFFGGVQKKNVFFFPGWGLDFWWCFLGWKSKFLCCWIEMAPNFSELLASFFLGCTTLKFTDHGWH